MKQVTALKLTCVGALVATLGVGCASTGYAKNDADTTDSDQSVGVSASATTGTESSVTVSSDGTLHTNTTTTVVMYDGDVDRHDYLVVDPGEARITVSALSMVPITDARYVNIFPFQDRPFRTIDIYTFAVPDSKPHVEVSEHATVVAPQFSIDLPAGSVFVEAAGGEGEVRTGRVIQHSPNPTR